MLGLSVVAFGIAWWLGLYLLARDPGKGVLRRAGLGLIAYAFGTSEEWRHYNALYFYYVRGVRPYSVRTKLTDLDPAGRRALSWFVDQVPERTLHNWQSAAARIVAADLRAGIDETVP